MLFSMTHPDRNHPSRVSLEAGDLLIQKPSLKEEPDAVWLITFCKKHNTNIFPAIIGSSAVVTNISYHNVTKSPNERWYQYQSYFLFCQLTVSWVVKSSTCFGNVISINMNYISIKDIEEATTIDKIISLVQKKHYQK